MRPANRSVLRTLACLRRGRARAVLLACVTGTLAQLAYADGEYRWNWVMDNSSNHAVVNSSPAVDADGTIYVGVGFETQNPYGQVVALVPTPDGKVTSKWANPTPLPEFVDSSPLLMATGRLYVGCWDGKLYAIDKTTGHIVGTPYDANPKTGGGFAAILGTPAASRDGQTIYTTVYDFDATAAPVAGELVALTADLQFRWSVKTGPIESSPVVADDGTIYFGSTDGIVHAVSPDGTPKWTRPLSGSIYGSVAIGGDGTIYLGSTGEFDALHPNDGTVKWSAPLATPGSAVVGADGTVYVANLSDFDLYALDWRNGAVKWHHPAPPPGTSASAAVVRADNVIICPAGDGVLRAYDSSGTLQWSTARTIQGSINSCPVISPYDHSIIVGATDGSLWAFNGNEYGISKYASWPMFQHDPAHSGQGSEVAVGGRLVNLATRGLAGPNTNLITGFVVEGQGSKVVLVRGVGPTLQSFGVQGAMDDPAITVHANNYPAFTPYSNDDWGTDNPSELIAAANQVGAFPLVSGSKDAAVLARLDPALRDYSATVDSHGSSGVALAELYDMERDNVGVTLKNLSSRGFVGTGENVLTPSLVVSGGKIRVLVRAVGPGLTGFGVTGVLQRPTISVYRLVDHTSQFVAANTGWTSDGWKGDLAVAAQVAGAFALDPNSTDSAMILALSSPSDSTQAYTFQISGVGGTTGEVLVEVYALPF